MTEEHEPVVQASSRGSLLRDVAVLQFKLIVDGLRDLLLVPASLIAGAVSLAKHEDGKPGPQFYELLRLGRDSEQRINLFGAYSDRLARTDDADQGRAVDIDDLVARAEAYVVDEVKHGGMTAQAKAKIDRLLDAIRRGARTADD